MNKTTFLLTIIYLLVIALYAMFNWNIFILELDVNFGFQVIKMPLIGGIISVGFGFYIFQTLSSLIFNVFYKKKLVKTKEELMKLKVSQNSSMDDKYEKLSKTVDEILAKINT